MCIAWANAERIEQLLSTFQSLLKPLLWGEIVMGSAASLWTQSKCSDLAIWEGRAEVCRSMTEANFLL